MATALAAWRGLAEAANLAVFRVCQAFAASLAAMPIAAVGAIQASLSTAERMESERGDWRALLNMPKPRTVEIRFVTASDSVGPLPEGSYVWFKGFHVALEGPDLAHPAPVRFDLGSASEGTTAIEPPDLAIITPGGDVIAFRSHEGK